MGGSIAIESIGLSLTKLSWSLDIDSAWDDVDALYGVATTAKNGLELYNAAQCVSEFVTSLCTGILAFIVLLLDN